VVDDGFVTASPSPVRFWGFATVGLAITLCGAACGPGADRSDPQERRSGPGHRPDKASIYGDARLVPTRTGERARRELALAGQVARLVDARVHRPGATEVDVQLDGAPRVTVSLRLDASEPPSAALREDVDRLVHGVVPDAELTLATHAAGSNAPPEPRGVPWPLVLALLGFGLSAGVFAERAAARGVLRLNRNGRR